MILKSILLSLCLLLGCDGSGNIYKSTTIGDGRIVKAQLADDNTGEILTIYWDTKLETFCEWTQVRDMKFCLPLEGRVISSVYSPCQTLFAGKPKRKTFTDYIRIDSLPIPRAFRLGRYVQLTAEKYNELLAGKYCTSTILTGPTNTTWKGLEEVSIEEFVSR